MKKYRFFYHYNKQHDKWSIHYRGKCHIVDDFKCLVETEGKTNKKQPKRVVQGFTSEVKITTLIAGGIEAIIK